MKPTALVTTKTRLRNSSSGRIGSLARCSTNGNATKSSTPTTSIRIGSGDPQAYVVPPRLVNSTIADSPPASTAAPR